MNPTTDQEHVILAQEGEPIPVDDVAPADDAAPANAPAPTDDGDGGSWLSELFSWAGDQIGTLITTFIDQVAPLLPALLGAAIIWLLLDMVMNGKGSR